LIAAVASRALLARRAHTSRFLKHEKLPENLGFLREAGDNV
jgi:hypothetical protein